MHLAVHTLFDFASTIAVLALLAVPYGMARDRIAHALTRESLLGLLFGLASVGAMLDPFVLADGVLFGMRNLPVGLAGAFLGPVGALAATAPAAAMRALIGGDGMAPDLTGLAMAGAAGVLWRALADKLALGRLLGPLLLGTMISAHLVALMNLPRDAMEIALHGVAPVILLLNLAGSLVIGNLVAREDRNAERQRQLDLQTITDPLTGIANRRGFERRTRGARGLLRARHGNAVLMIDVDRFKGINDTHGHAAGDAILRQIGHRLGEAVRGDDVFARLGGEEFAVYLADMGRAETEAVADRLRRTISEAPFPIEGGSLPVTISVGVHWQADQMAEWDAILAFADRALYTAKALGRDRVVFHDGRSAA